MKILDTQTGTIHEYGESGHDSLHVSSDGKHLTYYNLQNGDGSGVGDYRFVCDDGKVPAESQTAEALHADVYFNIGGWPKRPQCKWITIEGIDGDEYYECSNCGEPWVLTAGTPKDNNMNFCPNCGADMRGGEES